MKQDLKLLSQQVKKEADLLLKQANLIDFLKNYGDVYIRGSYELNLMVAGDIDIYVVSKKFSKGLSISVLNKLIVKNQFRGYVFYDFVTRRKSGFPKGYYLGLRTRFKGRKWKIDIWFMKSMDNVSNRFMKKVVVGLNDAKREKILELKKIIKDKKIELPSFVIYNAVIDQGVMNMKQLNDFALREGYKIS